MQLTDILGVAFGTGLGGATVALGDTLGWDPAAGIGIAWAMAAAMTTLGIALAGRLPSGAAAETEHVADGAPGGARPVGRSVDRGDELAGAVQMAQGDAAATS